MQDRFKFRVYIKYAKMMCYDVNSFYIDRLKNKITIHFDDHTKTFKFDDVVLEQSTGLKDKNGKLIYEGDIVKSGKHIYPVEWCVNGFAVNDGYDYLVDNEEWEIIGNIHENADLLEI
jgi:uncharacterized phage protein (TIGR01671 family)